MKTTAANPCSSHILKKCREPLRPCFLLLEAQTHQITVFLSFDYECLISDPLSRGVAVCKAKKQAHQRATENAFGKVVLVIMADGRLHVEVNTTVEEALYYDDDLNQRDIIKVAICCDVTHRLGITLEYIVSYVP